MFSTAVVDAYGTSLWTSPAAPFADNHLARIDDFFGSSRHDVVSRAFSTASVEGARTSLWISAIDTFADSDL
jgi:hypothetical protein